MISTDPSLSSRDSLEEKHSLGSSSASSPSSSSEPAEGLLYDVRELEAQPAPEHLTSPRMKIIFVALYFFLNLSLTLSNKSVLNHVSTTSTVTIPSDLN
jgi:hypothetical protein